MSTQSPSQSAGSIAPQLDQLLLDDKSQHLVVDRVRDWFHERVEQDRRVCDNCFRTRLDDEEDWFRSHGGNKQRKDDFCVCGVGTGMDSLSREWETAVDSHVPEHRLASMGGTVNRVWDESDPLPLNGERVSFSRLLLSLIDRLRERECVVDEQLARRVGFTLKKQHPSRDREIFASAAFVASETVD